MGAKLPIKQSMFFYTLRYSNSASFCSQARITFVLPDALAQLIPEEIGTPFRSLSSTLQGCRYEFKLMGARCLICQP